MYVTLKISMACDVYGVNMVLSEKDMKELKRILSPLEREVKILFFRDDGPECMYCDTIQELLGDIHTANEKVTYEVYHVKKDTEVAQKYGIEKGPVLLFEQAPRMQYWGIPSGREFPAFLGDILFLGTGKYDFDLNPHIKEHIDAIDEDLIIYVFVTPRCPYCPYAVKAAHRIAYLSPHVTGIMVEAIEYSALADQYNVSAVPKNVIIKADTGETLLEWEGCPPEINSAIDMFVHQIHHALLHAKGEEHHHEH